ncbi:TetR/AcrR family transcriptional regulator [Pimelobacter simplex]|uniref:TetR/AcrR family transcriptional regulator n=1 Tax=Nocardioides simplex TaxID=2045 RepID=A0A7J5DTZ9_NOCSI|nr:TetR/AcrR family transcriptional regulator [Pimelobacter simplex]KAB2808495.1 TetR/AcrR family transcriptional regulator [Pimelobacter simplex]
MTTSPRGARRKARTATAILDAAEGLFRERGLQATTIDEVAEAADVSVGSVYVHFKSKTGLYLALVERALDLNEQAMARVLDLGLDSPLERVLAAGDAYLRFHLEHPGAFQMIALRVLEPGSGQSDPEVEERIAERVEALVGAVQADLEAAVRAGEIRADVDLARATRFVWGAWNGVIALSLRQDRLRIDDDELVATLAVGRRLLSDALRADAAGQ